MDADATDTTYAGCMTADTFDASEIRWRNCFVSSTLPWMSDNDPKTGTVQEIVDKFQTLANTAPPLAPPKDDSSRPKDDRPHPTGQGPLQWRIGTVSDFREENVPAAAERLIRWEFSPPREVFKNGIISLAERFSSGNKRFAVSNVDDLVDPIAELRGYIRENRASVFVSTTRTFKDSKTGKISRVTPKDVNQVNLRYEYEIFVHGGIDAELSGESGTNFNPDGEREITVPGGIRREFIRSARKYRGDLGVDEIPTVWKNPYFNPSANGLGRNLKVSSLPDIVNYKSGESEVKVRPWPRPRKQADDLRATTAEWEGLSEDPDDFEDGPPPRPPSDKPFPTVYWTVKEDKLASTESVPMARAAFTKGDGSQVWITNGCVVELRKDNTAKSPPQAVATYWPGLLKAGITRIDAVLSTPAPDGEDRLFLFSGELCCQIDSDTGGLKAPIQSIRDAWPPLAGKDGFSTVSAALSYPAPSDRVVFFSGSRYALLSYNFDKGSKESKLIQLGDISSRWTDLRPGQSIDSAIKDRNDPSKVNFTSGEIFIATTLEPSVYDKSAALGKKGVAREEADDADDVDVVVGVVDAAAADEANGVSRGWRNVAGIAQSRLVAQKWPALGIAGFY